MQKRGVIVALVALSLIAASGGWTGPAGAVEAPVHTVSGQVLGCDFAGFAHSEFPFHGVARCGSTVLTIDCLEVRHDAMSPLRHTAWLRMTSGVDVFYVTITDQGPTAPTTDLAGWGGPGEGLFTGPCGSAPTLIWQQEGTIVIAP